MEARVPELSLHPTIFENAHEAPWPWLPSLRNGFLLGGEAFSSLYLVCCVPPFCWWLTVAWGCSPGGGGEVGLGEDKKIKKKK